MTVVTYTYKGKTKTLDKGTKGYQAASSNAKSILDSIGSAISDKLNQAVASSEDGLKEVAEKIFEISQDKAPEDTGQMKKSGFIEYVREGDKLYAVIGYDKDDTAPYVVIVHENLDFNHPNGGEAKFLQNADNKVEKDIANIQASKIKGDLK